MKTIATILLVLVAAIGMAAPVLGATAGSSGSSYADWGIAIQDTDAWAGTDDEYVDVNSYGVAEGYTESTSDAGADDFSEVAEGDTNGYSEGDSAYTESNTYAQEWDIHGYAATNSDSTADGDAVDAGSYTNAYWGDLFTPIYSEHDSWASATNGFVTSSGHAIAED